MTLATHSPDPSASAARARLLQLISELAVVRGRVTLSSGKEADYYVDLRRITMHAEAAPLVGAVMLDLLDAAGLGPAPADPAPADPAHVGGGSAGTPVTEAVGGLTMGADPVAQAVMHAGAARGRAVDAFAVRKEAKAHGLQRRVEGPDVVGRRVVAVEDTSTTGGSVMTAVEALREVGAEVVGVAVILDRDTGAREVVEAAGLTYLAAFTKDDLGL